MSEVASRRRSLSLERTASISNQSDYSDSEDLSSPGSYKDAAWLAEDNTWCERVMGRFVEFRWSSGCGSGKSVFEGKVTGHFSTREDRDRYSSRSVDHPDNYVLGRQPKRIDYLVIKVGQDEDSYKLGKDIRKFLIFKNKGGKGLIGAWSSKDGWEGETWKKETFEIPENIEITKFIENSENQPPNNNSLPKPIQNDFQKNLEISTQIEPPVNPEIQVPSNTTIPIVKRPEIPVSKKIPGAILKSREPFGVRTPTVNARFVLQASGVEVLTSHAASSIAGQINGFTFFRSARDLVKGFRYP